MEMEKLVPIMEMLTVVPIMEMEKVVPIIKMQTVVPIMEMEMLILVLKVDKVVPVMKLKMESKKLIQMLMKNSLEVLVLLKMKIPVLFYILNVP